MAKVKTLSVDAIKEQVTDWAVEFKIDLVKYLTELISKEEKEAEEKLKLIRGGNK